MKPCWKPIVILMLLSAALTELLTTNTPATKFFSPWLFFFLTILGYGLPVLVVREVYIRKNYGLWGLLILGLIYGLYNEGMIARTIFAPYHSPFDFFASYGLVANIRVPWALSITFWHALYAVIFPIAFTQYLFPNLAKAPWLGTKATKFIIFALFIFGTLGFLSANDLGKGQIKHLIFMLVAMVFLFILSRFAPGKPELVCGETPRFSWKKVLLGFGIYWLVFTIIPVVFAKNGIHPALYAATFLLWVGFVYKKLSKYPSLALKDIVLFALGAELGVNTMVLAITLPVGRMEQAVSSIIFILVFTGLILVLRKNNRSILIPV